MMPITPPTVLRRIDEIESMVSPQRAGMSPPTVDPTNSPIQIKGFAFTAAL